MTCSKQTIEELRKKYDEVKEYDNDLIKEKIKEVYNEAPDTGYWLKTFFIPNQKKFFAILETTMTYDEAKTEIEKLVRETNCFTEEQRIAMDRFVESKDNYFGIKGSEAKTYQKIKDWKPAPVN